MNEDRHRMVQLVKELVGSVLTRGEIALLVTYLLMPTTADEIYKIIDDVLPLVEWPELKRRMEHPELVGGEK